MLEIESEWAAIPLPLIGRGAPSGLSDAVAHLRSAIEEVSRHAPLQSDGANWSAFDGAVDDLYRGLQQLETVARSLDSSGN